MSRTFQLIRLYRDLTVAENMELSIQWGGLGVSRLFSGTDPGTRRKVESAKGQQGKSARAASLSGLCAQVGTELL